MRYFLLIFLFVSCQQSNQINEDDTSSCEVDTTYFPDLKDLSEKEWKSILELESDCDSMVELLAGKKTMENNSYSIKKFKSDWNGDGEKEWLLQFISEDETEAEADIFIGVEYKNGKYSVGEALVLELGFDFDPIIDTTNGILMMKSRVWGTCDDGFVWRGYRLKNGNWENVLDMYGDHEGNSCGTFEEDDTETKDIEWYYSLHSDFKFLSKDSIICTSTVSKWKHDFNYDVKMADFIKERKTKILHVYDYKIGKFIGYSTSGRKLKEDEKSGMSFSLADLMERGEL